jgi:hypothetical protein
MSKATKVEIRRWMLAVMARQAAQSEADVQANVALSLAAFQSKFPAEAFCGTSIDYVVGNEKFWNEAAVMRRMSEWCDANAPAAAALPPEAANAPVSEEAKQWLAFYYRAPDDAQAVRCLDLLRSHSPQAFAYLMRVDINAASIAVYRKWFVATPADLAADWDDEAGIRQRARRVVETMRDTSAGDVRPVHQFTSIGQALTLKATGMVILNAMVHAVKLHAPQHAEALLDELRSIKQPVEIVPVPVAFSTSPTVDIAASLFE